MRIAWIAIASLLLITGCSDSGSKQQARKSQKNANTEMAEEVNVYSARKESLIEPLLNRFTDDTGIKVNLITSSADALITRMQSEGEYSPADLLLTVDAGRLYRAREAGLFQPVDSAALRRAVPKQYRHPEGYWHGLSVRSRVIVVAPQRVPADKPARYEGLDDKQWRERICIRSSNNIYNQSLVASLIAHNGLEATENWARGLVKNFARSPQGGDRDQIMAVAHGICDIAVVNTYYLALMRNGEARDQRQAARSVALRWPNQDGRGAHVNISGAGVAKHAPHPRAARKLLEFLVSDESQQWYAKVNNEYPVKKGVPVSQTLQQWGEFKADDLPLVKLGKLNEEAVRLMDRVGWQ